MNLKTNMLAAVAGIGVLAFANIAQAGHGSAYLDTLVSQLQNAYDEDDREDAAEDLGKLGDPAALPALQNAAFSDPDDDVREEALEAIERINRPRVIYTPAPVVYVQPAPVVYHTSVIHRSHYSHHPVVIHRSHHGHRRHFSRHGYRSHRGHGRSFHVSFGRHH